MMKFISPKSVGRILRLSSATLAPLLTRVQLLARLTRTLHSHLPTSLAQHCQVANLKDGVLVIGVDSPAWAARLRYQLPQLLRHIQADDIVPDLTELRMRIQPAAEIKVGRSRLPVAMSTDTGVLLSQVAEGITDPDLRAALKRLSRRGLGRD